MSAKIIHKLLIAGSTGLVGSRFLALFKNKFSIKTLGRRDANLKIDLTSKKEVTQAIETSDADAVINFAAYTNVDGAEKEKGDKDREAYKINVMLPSWLAQICKTSGKKLCHISTDYVFDGKQNKRPYTEEDIPSPVNSWYCITKYEGERKVMEVFNKNGDFIIIRISYPYNGLYKRKLDIARAVLEKLKNDEDYFGISDQKIKPTSVDDIAKALMFLLKKGVTGIYHVAGNFSPREYITPYEFAQSIAEILNLNKNMIKPTSFTELSKKRLAPRPQHTWLDTKKIESLGFKITQIDKALERFRNQLSKSLPF